MQEIIKDADIKSRQERYDLLIFLANMLAEYGETAYEIEDVLAKAGTYLKIEGHYMVLGSVLLVTSESEKMQRFSMRLLPSGTPVLNKLEQVRDVIHSLISGNTDPKEARKKLESIKDQKEAFGKFLKFLCWPLVGGGFAVFFGGSLNECIAGAFISSVLYFIYIYFSGLNSTEKRRMFEPVASIAASFLAILCSYIYKHIFFVPNLSVGIASLSGMMMLMPGLTLTKAMNEIALGHTISGMSRFLNALTTLMFMATGIFLATKLKSILDISQASFSPQPANIWIVLTAIIGATYGLCVYASVKHRHFLWVLMVTIFVSMLIIKGSDFLSPVLATGFAAFISAVFANLYSRIRNCSDSIIKVPNAYILVPGATGFSAIVLLTSNQIMPGIIKLLTTIEISLSIIVAFIFADIIFPPKKFWE